jgi:hypothetical protein
MCTYTSIRLPETILNLGINNQIVEYITNITNGNQKFALDIHRRFIYNFSTVVLGYECELFDEILLQGRDMCDAKHDKDLSIDALKYIIKEFMKIAVDIPTDPVQQLKMAVASIYRDWSAVRY